MLPKPSAGRSLGSRYLYGPLYLDASPGSSIDVSYSTGSSLSTVTVFKDSVALSSATNIPLQAGTQTILVLEVTPRCEGVLLPQNEASMIVLAWSGSVAGTMAAAVSVLHQVTNQDSGVKLQYEVVLTVNLPSCATSQLSAWCMLGLGCYC